MASESDDTHQTPADYTLIIPDDWPDFGTGVRLDICVYESGQVPPNQCTEFIFQVSLTSKKAEWKGICHYLRVITG